MKGIKIGTGLKQMVSSREWWESVTSNMVATILGILLTVGVAEVVEHRNNKKLAREMMFNIVNTADQNVKILEGYDSVYEAKVHAITEIGNVYVRYDKDLTKVPDDTLKRLEPYFNSILHVSYIDGYLQPSEYFNSAEMMHQIGNADVYAAFAEFVRLNQETFATIDDLNEQSQNLFRMLAREGNLESESVCRRMNQLYESGELADFVVNVKLCAHLKMTIYAYQNYHETLLKMMDASEKEYTRYKKSNMKEDLGAEYNKDFKL